MRVNFDTVVLVRGLLNPHGSAGTLLFDETARYEWVVSPEIVEEYLQVLSRPRIASKFRSFKSRNLHVVLAQIATATLVHPEHIPAICRDPADDKFLAAATISNADFIVTADNDLLVLGSHEEITICAPEAFLQFVRQEPG